jgi:membrane protein
VFVGTLWELARRGFTAYVKTFGMYGRLYGSFGVGGAALVWVYYSSIIFVLGAELSAIRGEARARGADASAPITR